MTCERDRPQRRSLEAECSYAHCLYLCECHECGAPRSLLSCFQLATSVQHACVWAHACTWAPIGNLHSITTWQDWETAGDLPAILTCPRGWNPCALHSTRLAALWFPRGCCLCPFPSASVTWSAQEHQAASVLQMPTKRRCLRTGSCPQEGCLSLTGGSGCSPRPNRLHSPACWDRPENVVPARLPPPRLVCPRWSGSPVLPSGEGGVQLCLQAAEPWLGP